VFIVKPVYSLATNDNNKNISQVQCPGILLAVKQGQRYSDHPKNFLALNLSNGQYGMKIRRYRL